MWHLRERQVEELERHGEAQPRPPDPLWHTYVWTLTWLTFVTSTLLLGDSDWIFVVYAFTIAIFIALFWAQRRRAAGRPPWVRTPMSTRDKQVTMLAVLVTIGVSAVRVRYETPWPLIALTVVASVVHVVLIRRAHRAQDPGVA